MKNVLFISLLVIVFFVKNSNSFNTERIIEPSIRENLLLEKPSEELIKQAEPVLSIITEKKDKEKFCLFNYEFANRISKYNGSAQKYNDVYVKAGSLCFNKDFKKYIGLKDFSVNYMQEVISSKDKFVTEEDKSKLISKYKALAWVLGE